jgi:hypothetical protein
VTERVVGHLTERASQSGSDPVAEACSLRRVLEAEAKRDPSGGQKALRVQRAPVELNLAALK